MTTVYVRLTKAAEQQVKTKNDSTYGKRKVLLGRDVTVVGEDQFENAPKGWGGGVHYLHLPVPSPADPELENFEFPQELIEQVVCNQTLPNNEFPQGVYEHEGAKLVVQSYSETVQDGMGMGSHVRWTQSVTISAPSVKFMSAIYRLFMSRQIQPTEAWDSRGRKMKKTVRRAFTGPKRIICERSPYGGSDDRRSYHLTCDISESAIDLFFVPIADYNASKLAEIGEVGARVVQEIAVIPGVGGQIFLHRNEITVEKSNAFEWSDIEPAILEVLKSAFEGDPSEIEIRGFGYKLDQMPRLKVEATPELTLGELHELLNEALDRLPEDTDEVDDPTEETTETSVPSEENASSDTTPAAA